MRKNENFQKKCCNTWIVRLLLLTEEAISSIDCGRITSKISRKDSFFLIRTFKSFSPSENCCRIDFGLRVSPEKAAIVEHVLGGGIDAPVVSFPRLFSSVHIKSKSSLPRFQFFIILKRQLRGNEIFRDFLKISSANVPRFLLRSQRQNSRK